MTGIEKLYGLSVVTAWGRFGLWGTRRGLRAVSWPGVKFAGVQDDGSVPGDVSEMLGTAAKELAEYFAGEAVRFTARLDLGGKSDFARRVLRACARIPHGQIVTYSQLAGRVGSASSARAVGRVLASNMLPVVVPCHRVLRADGGLGGFSGPGGIVMKRRLLALENIPVAEMRS